VLRLNNHYTELAKILVKRGEHEEAARVAEEWSLDVSGSIPANYYAACFLARCAALAGKDPKRPEAARQDLARLYADRAMVLLHRAVRLGYHDTRLLKEDDNLAPLRPREDFQQLVAALEAKAKAKPPMAGP